MVHDKSPQNLIHTAPTGKGVCLHPPDTPLGRTWWQRMLCNTFCGNITVEIINVEIVVGQMCAVEIITAEVPVVDAIAVDIRIVNTCIIM